jgi:hypothetical protein
MGRNMGGNLGRNMGRKMGRKLGRKMGSSKRVLMAGMVVSAVAMLTAGSGVRAAVPTASQWATPLELDFGPLGVGAIGPTLIVTITNSGDTPLTNWAGGAVPAPFGVSQDCNIQGGVLPGSSCHYYFSFSPSAAGTFSATSSSSTNAGPINIIVHGKGVGAQASYDFHALDFGNVFANGRVTGSSPTQVVTITNTGLAPLTDWAGGGVASPFSASQDCNIAGGVLPGHSCHYFFDFSTTSAGTFSATSASSTNGGPITVDLSGAAHSVAILGGGQQVTPRSLDFGPVGLGSSAQLVVAITNHATTSNITGWAGGGVGAPFNASQDCNIAGGLPPGSTCHFYYSFSPTSAGLSSDVSNVGDSFGSFSVALQGTGVGPSLTANPLWLDFGPVALHSDAQQQVVTITNTGLSPLTDWEGGGVFPPFSASQDCNIAGGVLPGQSCHFYYGFSPTAEGSFSDTSTFSANGVAVSIKLQGVPEPTSGCMLAWASLALLVLARIRSRTSGVHERSWGTRPA